MELALGLVIGRSDYSLGLVIIGMILSILLD